MLTDRNLHLERANSIGGVQRLYKLANGYVLSLINAEIAHSYSYAWEAAVISDIEKGVCVYDTPLANDVEVFMSDDEANAFIESAIAWGESNA